ncbi:MAG TPA: hypothetical protein PK096_01590 [Candidatus Saccharibacteria bacterium]|nr:hypothetical protein [Candidatus Saccharibacteria bacterium]
MKQPPSHVARGRRRTDFAPAGVRDGGGSSRPALRLGLDQIDGLDAVMLQVAIDRDGEVPARQEGLADGLDRDDARNRLTVHADHPYATEVHLGPLVPVVPGELDLLSARRDDDNPRTRTGQPHKRYPLALLLAAVPLLAVIGPLVVIRPHSSTLQNFVVGILHDFDSVIISYLAKNSKHKGQSSDRPFSNQKRIRIHSGFFFYCFRGE